MLPCLTKFKSHSQFVFPWEEEMLKQTDFVSLRPLVRAQLLIDGSYHCKRSFDLLGVIFGMAKWDNTGYWVISSDICKKGGRKLVAGHQRGCWSCSNVVPRAPVGVPVPPGRVLACMCSCGHVLFKCPTVLPGPMRSLGPTPLTLSVVRMPGKALSEQAGRTLADFGWDMTTHFFPDLGSTGAVFCSNPLHLGALSSRLGALTLNQWSVSLETDISSRSHSPLGSRIPSGSFPSTFLNLFSPHWEPERGGAGGTGGSGGSHAGRCTEAKATPAMALAACGRACLESLEDMWWWPSSYRATQADSCHRTAVQLRVWRPGCLGLYLCSVLCCHVGWPVWTAVVKKRNP